MRTEWLTDKYSILAAAGMTSSAAAETVSADKEDEIAVVVSHQS
jgi:hypothetical protein